MTPGRTASRPNRGRIAATVAVPLVASLLVACGGTPTRGQLPAAARSIHEVGADVAITALGQVGVAYRYGGNTPEGFDCSGLVEYAHARHGVDVPRTSAAQYRAFTPVARREARAGDLVFFRIRGRIGHVGILVGDDEFVHAPSAGQAVRIETLDSPWYRQRLAGFGRLSR